MFADATPTRHSAPPVPGGVHVACITAGGAGKAQHGPAPDVRGQDEPDPCSLVPSAATPLDRLGEGVNSGTGRSYASEFFVPHILHGHFGDGYPMGHAYKDPVSGAALGTTPCIPMPVLAAATATYQTALLRGHGEKDKGGTARVFEEPLGVRSRGRAGHS